MAAFRGASQTCLKTSATSDDFLQARPEVAAKLIKTRVLSRRQRANNHVAGQLAKKLPR